MAAKVATVAVLVCRLCGDLRRLSSKPRKCECGRCGGAVVQAADGEKTLRADVWGPCSVVGMDHHAVQTAGVRKTGAGMWWVIAPGTGVRRTDVKP